MLIRRPYAEQMQWFGAFFQPWLRQIRWIYYCFVTFWWKCTNTGLWYLLLMVSALLESAKRNAKQHSRQVKKQKASFNNVTWSPKLLHWHLFQVFEWQKRAKVIDRVRHEIYFTGIHVITNPMFAFVHHVSASYDVNSANLRTKVVAPTCEGIHVNFPLQRNILLNAIECMGTNKQLKLRMDSTKFNRYDNCG